MEARRVTVTDRLQNYFQEREGLWLDGMEIARVAGCYGWRTRCSDLRKRGMAIENRQRRQTDSTGKRWTTSEYRYVAPAASEPQTQGHDTNVAWELR